MPKRDLFVLPVRWTLAGGLRPREVPLAAEAAPSALVVATRAADGRCGPGHVYPPLSPTGTEDGQGQGGGGGELKNTAALREMSPPPPPQAAGAVYYEMDTGEDDWSAPAAGRPAPLFEALPHVEVGKHGGIGYELVLSNSMPQGLMEAEHVLPCFLEREKEKEEVKEKEKAKTRSCK